MGSPLKNCMMISTMIIITMKEIQPHPPLLREEPPPNSLLSKKNLKMFRIKNELKK